MIIACLETLVEMFNAKFIFYSSVALAIGTIGIWVPVAFELDLNRSQLEQNTVYEAKLLNVKDFSGETPESQHLNHTVTDGIAFKLSSLSHEDSAKIENLSIFMYVIGILGILAAEHFIKERKVETEVQDATLTFSMFIWFIALALSFWALKEPKLFTWHLGVSCWLAVSLWLSYTVKKADFNGNLEQTKKKLRGEDNQQDDHFGGKGLQ